MTDTAPTPDLAPEPVPEAPATEAAATEATPTPVAVDGAPTAPAAPAAPAEDGGAVVGSTPPVPASPTATSTDELAAKLYVFDGLPDQVDPLEWQASEWTTPEGHVLYERRTAINLHYTEYEGAIR